MDARTIESGTEFVTARVEDRVAVITLNRPERRNALSPVMFDGLERALLDAETADDVGCVVLTGAGGAFCAGGDVKGMAEGGLGLVNRVVADEKLDAATRELAHRLAHGPGVAYRYMKENISRATGGASLQDCLDAEATHHVHTGLTEDHPNAVKAFVEKRTPVFRGR
jgi:enoyl-CoA hydratase/carnithine racemase